MAHRVTLDHPEKVKRLMVLDIAPTLAAFEGMNHKSVRISLLPSFVLFPSSLNLPHGPIPRKLHAITTSNSLV